MRAATLGQAYRDGEMPPSRERPDEVKYTNSSYICDEVPFQLGEPARPGRQTASVLLYKTPVQEVAKSEPKM
jgi:hypothetical protein